MTIIEDLTPPPFITFAIPFFFLLMGVELLIGKFKKETYYSLGDSIADLSTGILSQLSGIFLKALSLLGYLYIYNHYKFMEIPFGAVYGWVGAILLWDFCYYWLHRLSHEVNILWAGHVIHHHSEEYNLIVALRQTSLGGILSWIFFIPMAFLGFHPWVFLAAGQLNLIYQYWVHTKSIKSIGTVGEFLLSTPSHHRVHHAINPKYIDKNHGGIFIIWDRIFGTFQKEEEEPVYGTVKPLQSFNPVWANYHYYWEIFKMAYYAEGISNKLKVFIKPPGWYPSFKEKDAGFLPIPEVSPQSFQKYNPEISKGKKIYVVTWFIIVLLLSFAYLLFHVKLDLFLKVIVSLWIALSLLSLNALLESKKWAKGMDVVRLISTPMVGLLVYLSL
jgi:alkylglycerol monooxygenase